MSFKCGKTPCICGGCRAPRQRRELLLERYVRCHWPSIKGERPFIVRGPKFGDIPAVRAAVKTIVDPRDPTAKYDIARLLLFSQIVAPAWAVEQPGFPSDEVARRDSAIVQLSEEIPKPIDVLPTWADCAVELLEGLPTVEHFVTYLMWDAIDLQVMPLSQPVAPDDIKVV